MFTVADLILPVFRESPGTTQHARTQTRARVNTGHGAERREDRHREVRVAGELLLVLLLPAATFNSLSG